MVLRRSEEFELAQRWLRRAPGLLEGASSSPSLHGDLVLVPEEPLGLLLDQISVDGCITKAPGCGQVAGPRRSTGANNT
jgi:hypothetical protein